MDRLSAMQVFARVARLGSFSAAARALRVSTTAVSRQVGQLEMHLGIKLLQRTTRQLRLTDVGADYLVRCERILSEVDELESEVGEGEVRVRGLLRVTAGVDLGREHLAPLLPKFLDTYPEVDVELSLSDPYVDLVAEGFDLGIRGGVLEDSSLIVRPLAMSSLVAVASPAYLEEHGRPAEPADLEDHAAILDTNLREGRWTFETSTGVVRVCPKARVAINSPTETRAFALLGRGIALLPHFLVIDELRRGTLVTLFDDLPKRELPISAVYPERRHQSARAKAYIDYCAETFSRFGR